MLMSTREKIQNRVRIRVGGWGVIVVRVRVTRLWLGFGVMMF